ncbi:MAG TPA: hypothetical protein VMF07_18180 [Solirubrobacteraceae bacterium]|nr:hypothetical protein [Solirubrobacteraceae bacterium]
MRRLPDIRFSRSALVLIAIVSGLATFVILHGNRGRSPVQLAALAALRDKPHAPPAATTSTASTSATSPAGSGSSGGTGSGSGGSASSGSGSGGGGGFSGGSGGSGGGGGSSLPGTSVPSGGSGSGSTETSTTSTTQSSTTTAKQTSDVPKLKHVFEIMLSAPSYKAAFGHGSTLTALHSLIHKGTLLSGYKTLGAGELADELAAVSGQAPNHDTKRGCTSYVDFPTSAVANKAGLVPGNGCVYPDTALTIGDQVTASGATWGAYVADMGKETCVHPNSGAVDNTLPTGAEPGYDTRHNPFIYFHSLLDLGDCASDDVDLSQLPKALAHPAKTPAFAYVAPDACADGDPTMASTTTSTSTTATTPSATATTPSTTVTTDTTPAVASTTSATTSATSSTTTAATTSTTATTSAAATTPAGCPTTSPSGLAAENAFLKTWVPKILHSGAYRHGGALVIAFTRSGAATGHPSRAGALILSPDARAGAKFATAQTPYSLLRFDEDALHLTPPLAHAKAAKGLAAAVLTAKQG